MEYEVGIALQELVGTTREMNKKLDALLVKVRPDLIERAEPKSGAK